MDQCIIKIILSLIFLMIVLCTTESLRPKFELDPSQFQREIIKREILRKIGFKDRPFMKEPLRQPDKILDTVSDTSVTNAKPPRGDYFAEIQEVISLSEAPQNLTNDDIIQFRVVRDSQGRKLEVKSANVLVKVKYPQRPRIKGMKRKRNKRKKIKLQLSNVKVNNDTNPTQSIISTLKAKIRKTTWFKLKIPKEVIQNVLDSNKEILRLHVKCKGCNKGAKIVLVHGSRRQRRKKRKNRKVPGYRSRMTKKEKKTKKKKFRRKSRALSRMRPFLILHTKLKTYLRPKRSTGSCSRNQRRDCCKKNLVVDFSDFGWDDWILSPASFTTGMCEGSCSQRQSSGVQVTHNSTVFTVPIASNCTATRERPLSIIYQMQDNSIVISTLPNMITTRCGCRLS